MNDDDTRKERLFRAMDVHSALVREALDEYDSCPWCGWTFHGENAGAIHFDHVVSAYTRDYDTGDRKTAGLSSYMTWIEFEDVEGAMRAERRKTVVSCVACNKIRQWNEQYEKHEALKATLGNVCVDPSDDDVSELQEWKKARLQISLKRAYLDQRKREFGKCSCCNTTVNLGDEPRFKFKRVDDEQEPGIRGRRRGTAASFVGNHNKFDSQKKHIDEAISKSALIHLNCETKRTNTTILQNPRGPEAHHYIDLMQRS